MSHLFRPSVNLAIRVIYSFTVFLILSKVQRNSQSKKRKNLFSLRGGFIFMLLSTKRFVHLYVLPLIVNVFIELYTEKGL